MLRRRAATFCCALGMLVPVALPLAAPIAAYAASTCTNYTVTVKSPTVFGYHIEVEVTFSVCTS